MTNTTHPAPDDIQRAAALDKIRVGIDAVDDQIHDLLMRRAAFVTEVAETKRLPDGTLPKGAYRPAREAAIMRRLLSRNKPPLPFSLVFTCWREIIGGFTAMQSPVVVSVLKNTGTYALADTARNHFGAAATLSERDTFAEVQTDMRRDPSVIGIVPAPSGDSNDTEDAWWQASSATEENAPRVIAALPFYGTKITGYCLSTAPLEASGEDETLLVAQFGTQRGHDAVSQALETTSIPASALQSDADKALIRADGFHIAPDDPILLRIAAALDIPLSALSVAGAYPKPITAQPEKCKP